MKTYPVNETFLSLQGEGARAGSANVFVRFAGCNLTCTKGGDAGFDCDTEFLSSVPYTADQIATLVRSIWRCEPAQGKPNVILTGGEPLLHVDDELLTVLDHVCEDVCIETNGTRPLPPLGIHCWVSCSPKTAEHTLVLADAHELRYVRNVNQGIPKPKIPCSRLYLSPAWSDDHEETRDNLRHCINLVKENPEWRLSVQMHKLWNVR